MSLLSEKRRESDFSFVIQDKAISDPARTQNKKPPTASMFTTFASKDDMQAKMQVAHMKFLQSFLATSVEQRLGGLGRLLPKLNHDYVHAAAEHALDTEFTCTEVSYAVDTVSGWSSIAPNPQILDCCDESDKACRLCNKSIKFEEIFTWCKAECDPVHAQCLSEKLFEDNRCPVCKENEVYILGFEPAPGSSIIKLMEFLNAMQVATAGESSDDDEDEESDSGDT